MRSQITFVFRSCAAFLAALVPAAAFAHDGTQLPYGSFLSGLTHPVLGLDLRQGGRVVGRGVFSSLLIFNNTVNSTRCPCLMRCDSVLGDLSLFLFEYHNGQSIPPILLQFNINSLCLDHFGKFLLQSNDTIF